MFVSLFLCFVGSLFLSLLVYLLACVCVCLSAWPSSLVLRWCCGCVLTLCLYLFVCLLACLFVRVYVGVGVCHVDMVSMYWVLMEVILCG